MVFEFGEVVVGFSGIFALKVNGDEFDGFWRPLRSSGAHALHSLGASSDCALVAQKKCVKLKLLNNFNDDD